MMPSGIFITGTDTNIGKTWVTVALMRRLQQMGLKVAGMKPVAAGCEWRDGQLINQDALLIQKHTVPEPAYQLVNPYAFEPAVSPHLACGETEVRMETILAAFDSLHAQAEIVVVEGAGGWLSPLSPNFDNAGLAQTMRLPVILVVGMRLGCINHASLTYQAICRSGVDCIGWVAVEITADMTGFQANLNFLKQKIEAPLLGVMPHLPTPDFDFLATRFKFGQNLI